MGKIALGTTGAIAVITGVALLGFSPAGCSCISPVNLLSFAAGYSAPGTLLSPAALAAGPCADLHVDSGAAAGAGRDAVRDRGDRLQRLNNGAVGACG